MMRPTNYAILRFMVWRFILDDHVYGTRIRVGTGWVGTQPTQPPKSMGCKKSTQRNPHNFGLDLVGLSANT